MADRMLLIDLENVQKVDLSAVPNDVRVFVFYGSTQRKLPDELVVQTQPLGARLEWIRISGTGPNALDFHISFYLGLKLARRPAAECVIYSRDTGFDPLIRHLLASGHRCRRVNSLKAAFCNQTPPAPREQDHFGRLVALLTKEMARPVKRKGLEGKVKSWFPKLSVDVRSALLQRLFDEAHVRESDKALIYSSEPP